MRNMILSEMEIWIYNPGYKGHQPSKSYPAVGIPMLPTEVLCDSILVIFNECSNEPYITSISETEYLWRRIAHPANFG